MLQILEGESATVKLKFNKLLHKMTLTRKKDLLWLQYEYNKNLTDHMKTCFSGMTWHGYDKSNPVKQWSISYNLHNLFQLDFMVGANPYKIYDETMQHIETNSTFYRAMTQKFQVAAKVGKELKDHQKAMAFHICNVKRGIWAAEMGLGKSLAAIEAFEYMQPMRVGWISINSGLLSVRLEYKRWGAKVRTEFLTYDGLKKLMTTIPDNWTPFDMVIFDESQKIKTITAQRTEAAIYLVNRMIEHWGDLCTILLMTGTPAPKSPLDWYSQCEIARPGYIREGNIHHYKNRLALIEKKENTVTGGVYPELITWRDDENKCKICGKFEADHINTLTYSDHSFQKSVNEVELLYKRMKGLVLVKTKKECLDLPEKVYQRIQCQPSLKMKQAMKTIIARAETTIKALMLCRELSDGFQYTQEATGEQECPLCSGSKVYTQKSYIGPEKTIAFINELGLAEALAIAGNVEDVIIDTVQFPNLFKDEVEPCPACNGTGKTKLYTRETTQTATAKDKALKDILDEHDEYGRLIVYAGFQASIDKIADLCSKEGWEVIRVDGRGWDSTIRQANGMKYTPEVLVDKIFQQMQGIYPKVVFVGHPGSASTGLTLTASPTIVYYSNTFNADERIQSEDRIHRIGMDINRGAKIIDLIHLPTDEYVLENLLKKRKLQDMSIGQLMQAAEQVREEFDVVA